MADYLSKIVKLREAKGWTEYRLAQEAGLPQTTIAAWYGKKKTKPTVANVSKVAAALGVTMSQLFSDEDEAVTLTDSQTDILALWARLDNEQQYALLNLLEKWRNEK